MLRWYNFPEKVTEKGCRNNNLQKCGLITCCLFLSWCGIHVLIPSCHILLARQRRMCIMHALCLPHTDFLIHDVWWFWSRECVKAGYFCVSVETGCDCVTSLHCDHMISHPSVHKLPLGEHAHSCRRCHLMGVCHWAVFHFKCSTRLKVKCQTQSEAKDEYQQSICSDDHIRRTWFGWLPTSN